MTDAVQVLPDSAREMGITDERCFALGLAAAQDLFSAYAEELGIDLGFQGFQEELATLPGKYGPPWGVLLILWDGEVPVACGAIRSLPAIGQDPPIENAAEIKRMYVVPNHRGQGLSHRLMHLLLDAARNLGYRRVVLDTLPRLTAANALYLSAGFTEIESYNGNPLPDVRFFARDL